MNKLTNKNHPFWYFLFAVGFLLIIGAILAKGIQLRQATASKNFYDESYPAPATPVSTQSICDQVYPDNLKNEPKKKAIADKQYQDCLAALKSTDAPMEPMLTKLASTPDPKADNKEDRARRLAGNGILIFGFTPPIPPTSFINTSNWYTSKGNQLLIVYAGVFRNSDQMDLTQGGLIIFDFNPKTGEFSGKKSYPTPTKEGSITIVDVSGEQLTLATNSGTTFFFNIASRQYVTPTGYKEGQSYERKTASGTLVESGLSPFTSKDQTFSNQWYLEIDGKRTTVFLGREETGEIRGILMIISSLGEPTGQEKPDIYYLPGLSTTKINQFRIFDEKDQKIYIAGRKGEIIVFDLSSRHFLNKGEMLQLPEDTNLLSLEHELMKVGLEEQETPTP